MRRSATIGLALLALLACSCAGRSSPPKKPGEKSVVLSTTYDDERAGAEASEEVREAIGLVDDRELNAFVQAIGRRLALHAPGYRFDYSFHVVDQDAPNAFALPGGYIFVSRGLIALTNSEDELANVLGHEIIHVASRHAAARQQLGHGVPGLFQWFQMRSISAYGRDQERQADRLGQGLAGLAGYDPGAMATFLKDLEFTERLRLGASRLPSFFDTHPTTTERTAAAAERARRIAWQGAPGLAGSRADYLRRLDGLTVGPSAAEGVFRGRRFLHPDLGLTLLFPDGWETRNTRSAVGALSPRRDAQVFLEHQGRGNDPRKAADEYLEEAAADGLRVTGSRPLKLVGSSAFRAYANAPGGLSVILTWIAFRGHIYRLTGLTPSVSAKRYESVFVNVARSLRPLSRELRDGIQETRLRLVEARSGESLQVLSQRTGNAWAVQRTAVMNDVFANQTLEPGQLVKVAIAESYRPISDTP